MSPPEHERRPAGNEAPSHVLTHQESRPDGSAPARHCVLDEPDDLEVMAAVGAWARPFLRGDAPVFASPEWLAMDPADPRRAAAVVRAALTWWRCGDPLDENQARMDLAAVRQASWEISGRLGSSDGVYRPTMAELQRRRRHLLEPRPNDHPGGPVSLWGPVETEEAA